MGTTHPLWVLANAVLNFRARVPTPKILPSLRVQGASEITARTVSVQRERRKERNSKCNGTASGKLPVATCENNVRYFYKVNF